MRKSALKYRYTAMAGIALIGACTAACIMLLKPYKPVLVLTTQYMEITRVKFSPDGNYLASECIDGNTIIWEIPSGRHILSVPNSEQPAWIKQMEQRHSNQTITAEICNATAVPPKSITVYNKASHLALEISPAHPDRINTYAISPDGQLIVTGGGHGEHPWPVNAAGDIRIWDTRTGKRLARLTRQWHGVSTLDVSPDGNKLASGSFNGTVMIWDLSQIRRYATKPSAID